MRGAANIVSIAAYDTLGNVTGLVGPLGGNTQYSYDNLGRLITETTASGRTVSYGYYDENNQGCHPLLIVGGGRVYY